MSSKSVDRKANRFDNIAQELKNFKSIVTSFNAFFIKNQKFIYSGEERIPFKMRHPTYCKILLDEFANNEKDTSLGHLK